MTETESSTSGTGLSPLDRAAWFFAAFERDPKGRKEFLGYAGGPLIVFSVAAVVAILSAIFIPHAWRIIVLIIFVLVWGAGTVVAGRGGEFCDEVMRGERDQPEWVAKLRPRVRWFSIGAWFALGGVIVWNLLSKV